jgi:lysozyme family protein
MNDNFNKAMLYLFQVEGGYVNNKNDKGGATNLGITQKTYNAFLKKYGLIEKSVRDISKKEATQIYYENYWISSTADKISDFPLALITFDSAVNHGVSIAKTLLKQSNNDFYKFLNLRKEKYKAIVQKNPSQKVFYKGWLNRLTRLENYLKLVS